MPHSIMVWNVQCRPLLKTLFHTLQYLTIIFSPNTPCKYTKTFPPLCRSARLNSSFSIYNLQGIKCEKFEFLPWLYLFRNEQYVFFKLLCQVYSLVFLGLKKPSK